MQDYDYNSLRRFVEGRSFPRDYSAEECARIAITLAEFMRRYSH